MHRAVVIAVVLLFAVPSAAGAGLTDDRTPVAATAPTGQAPAEFAQIGVLTLESETRSGFETASVDVSASLTMQHDDATAQLDRYTVAASLGGLDDEQRAQVLDAYMDQVETRAEALREDERALGAAYQDRSIDTRTYVIELARIDTRAQALRESLEAIDFHAVRTTGVSYDARIQRVEDRLLEFDGPVRGRLLASMRGAAAPTRVYVGSAQTGVVLSMIDDDRYVREAYRADKRTSDGETINLDDVTDLLQEKYPTAYNESNGWGIETTQGAYRLAFRFTDGTLIAYVDGGSEDVFYEVRNRTLSAVVSDESAVATDNGTRLEVNRSYAGGPLRIATSDNVSGEPVQADVIVEEERLATGDDGVAWTLAPDRVQFTVTVVGPDGNVTTQVRTIEPVRVDGSG